METNLDEKFKIPDIVGFRLGEDSAKLPKKWWNKINFPIGSIGQFDADRALPWDPFIKVWESEDNKQIGVIFPRFCQKDDKLLFGVDRITEEYDFKHECKCEIYFGGDFVCRCGADEKNVSDYASSFKEVSKDYLYNVIKINLNDLTRWIWIDFPANFDETPLLPLTKSHYLASRINFNK